jgi:hypothetical protein
VAFNVLQGDGSNLKPGIAMARSIIACCSAGGMATPREAVYRMHSTAIRKHSKK